jgi:predicted nucleic acid-binding Zn ribbon protein
VTTAYTHIRYKCDACGQRFAIVYDGETPKAIKTLTDAELRRQQVESGVLRI